MREGSLVPAYHQQITDTFADIDKINIWEILMLLST